MKLKKLVSALVSGAMILGTMAAVPVFAEGDAVARIGNVEYTSLADALKFAGAANAGSNTVEIIKDIDLTNVKWTPVYVDGYNGADIVTIEGENHTISHISAPLFSGGFAGGSGIVIKDLTIKDSEIESINETGSGAFIESVDSMDKITLTNCNLIDSSVTGKRTGGLLGWTAGYNNENDGPVKTYVTISGCSVSGSTIVGESVGAINGHAGNNAWTYTTIENCTITNNIIKSIEQDDWRAGIVLGTANVGEVTINNITASGNNVSNTNDHTRGEGCTELVGRFVPGTTGKLTIDGVPYANNCKPAPVKIKGNYYATLADAVAAAKGGDTITLLSDAEGDGVIVPGGSNVTIDLNGFTYNVSGATVGSSGTETSGFQLLGNKVNGVYSGENNTKVTIKNGTLKATSQSCWILIQNYSDLTLDNVTLDGREIPNGGGSWPYTLSNNYGTTTITGATNIFARLGGTAFDSCKNGSYSIPTVTVETTGTINGNIELTGGNLIVKSGTFTSDVAKYVAEGYYQKKNNDNTYTVLPVEAKVIDTAKTTGATVTLDNLNKNTVVDPAEDATYKVVVSTPAADDAAAANEAIEKNDNDNNTSKAMFDITVVKVDSNGVEKDLSGTGEGSIKNQQVTLTLGETPKERSTVYVYHVDSNGVATRITTPISVNGNKVTFTAQSFSTYAVTYTAATPTAVADMVGVVFSPVSEGSNQYYINLKSLDGKPINRFMSTDLVFKNGCTTVDYDITPAANMTASVVSETGASREYRFNMDGKTLSSATGTGITIGTITFYGYGTLDFSIDTGYTSGHSVNIVNTAKIADNIVDNYMVSGGTLLVNDSVTGNSYLAADEKGTIKNVTLAPETKDLTVNIAYNNKINNNAAAYQDMTVTISGGDLNGAKTVELGETAVKSGFANNANVTVEYDDVNSAYTVKVAKELTQNVAYTVTVEGAGYRTARYTVKMTANKTLNFWNNVKDAEENIETGVGTPSKTNFLAGDIVKDNNINIYDLSAVVSYFGENELINDNGDANAYAKYDLNRDGVIDSKDVAYVLVSWGK